MKKRLMMVMCCGIMILGNLSGCNAMKTKETEYHWPTSTLVKSLPVPESKYGEIVLDAEDSFEIDVFNTSKSQFADYINACKENGFNVDYYGTEDSYDAENKDGYTLSLSYDKRKKTMNIDIYDLDDDTEDTQEPEETEEPEETDDSENAKDISKDSSKNDKKEKKKTSSKKKDGAVDADFKKMMDSAKTRKFKAIIVFRLDRISRNISDFASLIEELARLDISFVSIKEQFDTSTPMGRAMMYIASVFSQLERETIAERIRDNMHELAKTGRWLGGTTPTGYASEAVKSVTIDGKSKKACKLKLIPEEADIVRMIYDLYVETDSLTLTEAALIKQGIKTKNNNYFTRFSIKAILQNGRKVYESSISSSI